MALNFVLMLTEKDRTIPDAVDVYEKLSVDELRIIAFKDVDTDPHMARDLTEAAHADGRSVLLELADTSEAGQERGCQLALDLGVDRVVGTWRPSAAEAFAGSGKPEYWPFVGSMSGNPLVLDSSPDELAAEAERLSATHGVAGLVLMPYRQNSYDPVLLMERTAAAATVPFLIAGGVRDAAQITDIAAAGAWGFTMGGAALADRHDDPVSVTKRVSEIMRISRQASDAS
ncbi:4-hydroxythreonine-4-phosphate dehydrogenase [Streptomyces gelaticus]|uniref:4-hydroxythreonine-4-phosphate dehydrogenase n=2 Tax=Streptomyces gelaticus TaxID=285446 RepID=A0ABQ2VUU8_9ACTN|nr:4-hydroxythreonine-4-phosphate dehydrogenase [Streptomyces gelaticus]